MFEWFETRYGYLRFIDNWHKHPLVSRLLCKLGRHDYHFDRMDGPHAILFCFYCLKGRRDLKFNSGV